MPYVWLGLVVIIAFAISGYCYRLLDKKYPEEVVSDDKSL